MTDAEERVAIQAYRRFGLAALARRSPNFFGLSTQPRTLPRTRQGYANTTRVSHLSAMRSGRDGCTARPCKSAESYANWAFLQDDQWFLKARLAKTAIPNRPKRPRKARRLHPQSRRQEAAGGRNPLALCQNAIGDAFARGLPCALRRSLCRDPVPSAKG